MPAPVKPRTAVTSPRAPPAVRAAPRILIVGFGALGRWLALAFRDADGGGIAGVLARGEHAGEIRRHLPNVEIVESAADLQDRFDFALEVASHSAVSEHVPRLLAQGIDTAIASTGALADARLHDALMDSARSGDARLRLLSGAVGGLDLLRAHRAAGLRHVIYTGRKPPRAWKGGPHGPERDDEERLIFQGSARAAALAFPANANVASTVALAGMGLDATVVRLLSDPAIDQNVHTVEAESDCGRFRLELVGAPLAANPSTSALTAYSALSVLQGLTQPLAY